MDDNPKLEAAMQHLEACTDVLIAAHQKKFNVVARAASAAQTSWYVIIEAIRSAMPSERITAGWKWAEKAEGAMAATDVYMQNAVSFRTEKGREYALKQANNAIEAAADASYCLGKAATLVRNPRAAQYVSAARQVARGKRVNMGFRSQRATTQIENDEPGGTRRKIESKSDELFKYHTGVDNEGMGRDNNN